MSNLKLYFYMRNGTIHSAEMTKAEAERTLDQIDLCTRNGVTWFTVNMPRKFVRVRVEEISSIAYGA